MDFTTGFGLVEADCAKAGIAVRNTPTTAKRALRTTVRAKAAQSYHSVFADQGRFARARIRR
jgi:hypothetical protein